MIVISNIGSDAVYSAGSRSKFTTLLPVDGGMCVWVRQSGNRPTVAANGGALTFDRTLEQFIDGGAHSFDIASNGGFTAVAVVKFTGAQGLYTVAS